MWTTPTRKANPCLLQGEKPTEHLKMPRATSYGLDGPMQTRSLSGKKYNFVIVDDYSRYTWVIFLTHKSHTFETFKRLAKRITIEKNGPIIDITIIEVENSSMKALWSIVRRKRSSIDFWHQRPQTKWSNWEKEYVTCGNGWDSSQWSKPSLQGLGQDNQHHKLHSQ